MAKDAITDWSATPADNTDIGGVGIQDANSVSAGAAAIREAMSQIADVSEGNAPVKDTWSFGDPADLTKRVRLDAGNVTAGQTRVLSLPDADIGGATIAEFRANLGITPSPRNRVVNHDMRMSQENGTTAGTTNGYYAADQWATYRVTSAGTITSAQVASVTPAGSPNRYRVTITTGDASLAAGEYLTISQNLEGSNVADFQYGGSSAKDSVLRFGFKGPAGTYAVALHNSAADRSYVALFTIEAGDANTDTVQTIAIPGDETGTWLTADGVIGITLDIVLACGSTFQGTTGWQAGNILGTSAVSNGMGTGSAVFELFDVGLKIDPDATGVYGQYEAGEVHPVYRSEAYYWKGLPVQGLNHSPYTTGAFSSWSVSFSVKMRKVPAMSVDFTGITLVSSNTPSAAVPTVNGFRILVQSTGAGVNAAITFVAGNYIAANARLSA